MPYMGTDRQAELKTLHAELAYEIHKLRQNADFPEPWKVIQRHIKQIRKDILRYSGEK